MSNYSTSFLKGMDGELEVKRILSSIDDLLFVENLYLNTIKGTCQIDFVALTATGIFVIEVKNIIGNIFPDLDKSYWKVSGGNYTKPIPNPLLQNSRHLLALRNHLGVDYDYYNKVVFPDKAVINNLKDVDGLGRYSDLYSLTKSKSRTLTANEMGILHDKLLVLKEQNKMLAIRHNKNSKRFLDR